MRTKTRITTLAIFLICALVIPGMAFAQPTDIAGHWAEGQINEWVDKGLAGGYPDGTFKPNQQVTRAEFVALTNRAFEIESEGYTADFTDVKQGQWYYDVIAAAQTSGYIGGYSDGTFKPQKSISRQEAASILARLLDLDAATGALEQFKDGAQIPEWSRGSVGALVEKGLMGGYPDGTFKATRSITRAEAIVTLDRAMGEPVEPGEPTANVFDEAGTYGPQTGIETIYGNVTIKADDVTLQNVVITGDLTLAEEIGDGDVTLRNVEVKGETFIYGGGSDSITLEDCTLPSITITKDGVRVVAIGNTTVNIVKLENGATLVEIEVTGPGFETVTITETIPEDKTVTLEGDFEEVNIEAEVSVDIEEGSSVEILTVDAKATITGEGTIEKAVINEDGVEIEQEPNDVDVARGVTAIVAGEEVKGSTGGGGGGGGGETYPEITEATVKIGNNDYSGVRESKNNFTFTLPSSLDGNEMVTSFTLKATADADTLTVSVLGHRRSVEFENGTVSMSISDLLGELDSNRDGVSVSKIRTLLATGQFTGELTDATGHTSTITLQLTVEADR